MSVANTVYCLLSVLCLFFDCFHIFLTSHITSFFLNQLVRVASPGKFVTMALQNGLHQRGRVGQFDQVSFTPYSVVTNEVTT